MICALNRPSFYAEASGFSLFFFLLVWNREASAQNYILRYVDTDSGAITFVGNTLGLNKAAAANSPGTSGAIGAFITLNTNLTAVGTYGNGTTLNWSNDSSAAVLRMPTNSTVLYAELIWAGSAELVASSPPNSSSNVLANLTNAVHFILPSGSSNNVSPDPLTASIVTNLSGGVQGAQFYVRSANVTALVQAGTARELIRWAACGNDHCGVRGCVNNACGWTLAVVYENSSLHQRNLSLFVGNSFATSGGPPPAPVGVVGFCAPPTGVVNGFPVQSARLKAIRKPPPIR